MKRLVLFSTFFGLLLVSAPGAIAETHILEGSFENIGQDSGHGNFDGNLGLAAPALPPLGLPSGGLPALPPPPGLPTAPSGLLPAMPGVPMLPALPAFPAPPPGLPTLISGLPSAPPDLNALLASISTPLTLEAPLGLPIP
jgi:hypothetical protein